MPYNSNYTYILVRIHGQSNHIGRSLLSSIPNSGMYAPYSNLSSSYELKGTSSNSVKVYHESELKEATLENYNLNTLVVDGETFTDHTSRLTTEMGSWLSCINDVRAALDADGNNNDLIVYSNTRGGMSAVSQPATMSLDVDEFTRLGLNAFIEYVLSSGISNPYLIFSMNQGESDDNSPATAAAALVSWNKWQVDLKQRFGYAPPFIVNAPDWDRTNILASLETYITNNSNVYSSYGTTLADSIDEIQSLHNATGVGTAIDKTNSGTYTIDGTHFNYAANIQSGIIEAARIRELATGFGDSVIPKTYVVVLAGESTAVGRSNDKTVPPDTTDPRIKQLGRLSPNNNTAILADDPLEHNDTAQASNSIGYGMSYARALLPNIGANDEILLVPVGQGGSGFYDNSWNKGDSEYNDAVSRANTALALNPNNSILIWVTALGINDGFHTGATSYESQFDAYDYNIRQDVTGDNYEMLHMILGLIPAVQNRTAGELAAHNINVDAPNRLDNVVYVQWNDGLPISVSDIHSDGASNRTMGARLYTNQAAFTPTPQPIPDVPSNLTVTPQDGQALVTWDLVNNADSYVLEYKLNADTTFTEVLTTSASNTVSGLTNSFLYNFRVKSRNTVGDSSYTSEVDSTPVASLTRESGAEIHHVFGTDYATWEDIQGGGALTPLNTSPSNSTGYTATAYVGTNGLESAIQHDTTGKTVIAVVKIPETTNGTILMGNINDSGSAGGWGIYESADEIKVLTRGLSNVTLKSTTDYNNYIFIAFSMDGSSHLAYYDDSLGGKTTLSLSGSIDSTTRNICVGNGFFTNTSFGTGVRIAEFIIFDSAKTESELDDIKARSATRLASRGITLGFASVPATPTNLVVTPGNNLLDVTFDVSLITTDYVVAYKLSSDPTFTEVVTSTNSVSLTSLVGSSAYDVKVKARNPLGDSAYTSVVVGTPNSIPASREAGAAIHHFFGTDMATFEDIQGGGALTAVGGSQTNGAGFVTLGTGMSGLESAVAQASVQTVIIVQKLVNSSNGAILVGNLNTSSGGGGVSLFESADDLYFSARGTAGSSIFHTPTDYNNYVFLAYSSDTSSHLAYYNSTSAGAASTLTIAGTINAPTPVRPIAAGNSSYSTASFGNGSDVAEFIIFNGVKTASELDAIFARSVARLGVRGITL